MTSASHRAGLSWASRLLIALALVLAGAAVAAWALARYDGAARFFGVTPQRPAASAARTPVPIQLIPSPQPLVEEVSDERIAEIDDRLDRVETTAERVEGSAGRADALLVAFAARRAIDRGLELGYLEPLLLERFGTTHPRAVSAIITGARHPVRLGELTEAYRALGPELRSSAQDEGWWAEFKHELGSLISVRRADRPSTRPDARYDRAVEHLSNGEVDAALAETMRLPGAARAGEWAAQARRYIAVQRALDEIETAALLGRTRPSAVE